MSVPVVVWRLGFDMRSWVLRWRGAEEPRSLRLVGFAGFGDPSLSNPRSKIFCTFCEE